MPAVRLTPVHPTRTRARRATEGSAHYLTIHTSEQAKATTSSAENLAAAWGTPATATNTASYHYAVDLDTVCAGVSEGAIAFHAPPNWRGIGLCLTGRADRDWTGVTDGVDDVPELELAAELAADICHRNRWPVRRLTVAQMQAGLTGICGHVDVTAAFGQTTHWDPGPGFPWVTFLARVQFHLDHLTGDNMPTEPTDTTELLGELVASATPSKLVRFDGYPSVFLIGAGPALHLTNEGAASYQQDGYEVEVWDPHPLGVLSVLHQAGIPWDAFVDPSSLTLADVESILEGRL